VVIIPKTSSNILKAVVVDEDIADEGKVF